MTKKILLINSDLAKNRGDRAIAEGIIALIRQRFPDASITGISQLPERDKAWFGINFLNMNFQSLSPFEFIRLFRAAQQSDVVLWGGGEILKDYTNKAALWYWVVKMSMLSIANKNLYGTYQGIGPTKSNLSKRLICFVVKRCKVFIVRDQESYDKLTAWGVPREKIRASSDPAVLPLPEEVTSELSDKLRGENDIDETFLSNFICIGPRDWFHYKPSGFLPFKYKRKLYSLLGKRIDTATPQHARYIEQLTNLISALTKQHRTSVLLVPMHMEEGDGELCELLKQSAANPDDVRILKSDTYSASEVRSVIARAKTMVGFRLHSNIVGVSASVPSINIYYVDKGRVFFDQIGQQKFALPIESVLDDDFVDEFLKMFSEITSEQATVRKQIDSATSTLRESVVKVFNEVFE